MTQAVAKALASNPNTPPQMLAKLLPRYPEQVLTNPVFPLLALENPLFLDTVERKTLVPLLQRRELPETVVRALTLHHDKNVAQAARLHIALGEAQAGWEAEALSLILTLKNSPWDRQQLLSRNLIPSWLWDALPRSRKTLPKPEPCPPKPLLIPDFTPLTDEERANLPRNENKRWRLATSSNRIEVLKIVAQQGEVGVAGNPLATTEILTLLVESVLGDEVVYGLLSHPNCPLSYLERWVTANVQTASAVIDNPGAPLALQQQALPLALYAGSSTRLPTEALLKRWQQLPPGVRIGFHPTLLARPDCPLDDWLEIMEQECLQKNGPLTRFTCWLNFTAPSRLDQAARASTWFIRFAIGLNSATPRELLTMLRQDANRYVRAAAQSRLDDPRWRFTP